MSNIEKYKKYFTKELFETWAEGDDPVIYSGRYHSLGKMLGEIGDFCK